MSADYSNGGHRPFSDAHALCEAVETMQRMRLRVEGHLHEVASRGARQA